MFPLLLGKYPKYNFVLNESSFVQSYDVSHIIKCLGCSFPNFPSFLQYWHRCILYINVYLHYSYFYTLRIYIINECLDTVSSIWNCVFNKEKAFTKYCHRQCQNWRTLVKCLGCSFPNFTLQLAPDAMSPWHSITLTACPISQFTRRPPTNESAVSSLATNQRPGGRGRAWQLNFPQLTLQQLSCRQCSPRTDAAAATNMLHNLWTKTVSLHASSGLAWPPQPPFLRG